LKSKKEKSLGISVDTILRRILDKQGMTLSAFDRIRIGFVNTVVTLQVPLKEDISWQLTN
jgi:hypothetical protein